MRKGLAALLALLMLVAVGCGNKAADTPADTTASTETGESASQEPVHIVVAQGADAVTLDPHKTNDQPSSRVMKQIYDTLVEQTEDLELKPGLATEWNQIDDVTWEFKLRQGVKFHNGETLTARDVKFTFDRLVDPETKAPAAFLLEPVQEVQVVDDYTVRIVLKYPFAPILSHLAHTAASILNEKAVTEAGEDYGSKPIGTGPFKFVSWTKGSHIELERFDEYWGGPAKAQKLTFRNIPEGATRAIELETGAIDIAYNIEPQDYERLQGDPNIQLVRDMTLSTNYIGFNVQKPPFDKLEVRQAINHAVNVDEIIEHILQNIGQKARGPISPLVWGAHPDLKGYEYDPEKAKELLAKAGYPNGFETTLWTNDNPVRVKIAEKVQADLAKIGVSVKIEVVEWGKYLEDTAAGKHDMFILGWVTVTGDADYGLYPLFHSSQHGSPGNRTFYTNPRVDELLDKGRQSSNPEERLQAYREAQELITADAPWLFLNVGEEVTGLAKNVKGFVMHPAGHHRLKDVTK
ncbi:MAG: glutathione ABC transporter substrate-binding protein [Bacillota bacterium]